MINRPTSQLEQMKPDDFKYHGIAHEQDDIIEFERKVK